MILSKKKGCGGKGTRKGKRFAGLLVLLFLLPVGAWADSCATQLMPLFTSGQATKLCASYDSFQKNLTFSDPGANTYRHIGIDTADGSDDALLGISACNSTSGVDATRCGYMTFSGVDGTSAGRVDITTGGNGDFRVVGQSGAVAHLTIDGGTGVSTFFSDIDLTTSGRTLILEDGTAASTCIGTVTANGTTAVTTATTCPQTGDYIFISRNSAPSGTAQCWTTNIVNGTSFDLDCDGAETGTFHWIVIKGQ